jgi:hypothetical protein
MKLMMSILLMSGVVIVSGCKKDKTSRCRIVGATVTSATLTKSFHISYNSDGRISKMVSSTSRFTYSYSGNTTAILFEDSSFGSGGYSFFEKNIVTVSAEGLVTNIRREGNASGTEWINTAYEYNGQEVTRETKTTSNLPNSPSIINNTWSNGNMISQASSGATPVTFGYYSDQPNQEGNFFYVNRGLLGAGIFNEIYKNKNLVKSIENALGTGTFAYDFRADGKISSFALIASTGDSYHIDYEYECN